MSALDVAAVLLLSITIVQEGALILSELVSDIHSFRLSRS